MSKEEKTDVEDIDTDIENSEEKKQGARQPILLPKSDWFTVLLVEKIHKQNFHIGVSQTLSQIRFRFWIPQGRSVVKSVLRKCRTCRYFEGGPYKMPPFSPLPSSRVQKSTPFSRIGLDYFGPLLIKTTDGPRKTWVCLFTCLVTRAIHMELLQDMSAEEFLFGFKRFVSQRGTPTKILSDNASQFKSASETINIIWRNVCASDEVQSYVANCRIKWKFIVELAPWMGVAYERLVGIVKRSLRKSLGHKILTLIQMQTLLKEVEATVNSRPLVYVNDDINSNITLTPNQFLGLNPKTGIPTTTTEDMDSDYSPYEITSVKLLSIWRKGQHVLNEFWKIWREEYLTNLRERMQSELKSKKTQSPYCAQVGDVVLIKENLPRGVWRMGRICELLQSRDGQIRSAKVNTATGKVLGRPLNLLYPVECVSQRYSEMKKLADDQKGAAPVCSFVEPSNPFARKASDDAKRKIKELFNND
ncbi:uncharacterized protein LOC123529097 [Mercenaria mercenaria]|uniref:uncharacterized protein LOC123529097 n=1 Tax=Mercenaria mercenaria TaxID=6596 RepID=UPI00234E9FD8|nr:uncharacterized protein LOC123529097 [Mercenaria mercenaria]